MKTTATPKAPTEGTGTQGTEQSVEDRFASWLGAPQPEDTPEPDTDEPESIETEDEPDVEAEADADDEPEVEAESAEDADESEDEPTYTVKVAGEELQVPLSELLAGYSRTGDYKRKTAEVAEQRRAVEAERQAVVQEREQYAAALPQLRQLIEQSIGPEPDPEKFDNRADYLYAKDQWNTAKAQAQAVRLEQERIQTEQQREQAERFEAFKRHHAEKLAERLPEWSDPAVRSREQSELAEYLVSEGYDESEIAQLWDHRAVILARKARLYDQLQASGKAKVKAAKPAQKAATPGAGGKIDTRGRALRQQRERLKQTGSTQDAAPLFQRAFQKK